MSRRASLKKKNKGNVSNIPRQEKRTPLQLTKFFLVSRNENSSPEGISKEKNRKKY